MHNWLLIAISDDMPVLLQTFEHWADAAAAGNNFFENHDILGRFLSEPPEDGDEGIVVDSARFAGYVGIYNLNEVPFDEN